jgi:hypothetical protein
MININMFLTYIKGDSHMKILLAMVVAAFALGACSQFNDSPEQKQFKAFVAHCKAAPDGADCKAWKETKIGGPE